MTIQVTFMKKIGEYYNNIINFCVLQILFVSISYLSGCRCLFIINYFYCTLSPLTHNQIIIIIIIIIIMLSIYNTFILIFDLIYHDALLLLLFLFLTVVFLSLMEKEENPRP